MWNFEDCKEMLALQYVKPAVIEDSGLSCDELEKNLRKLCRQSEKISVARAKSDGICYILRNAQLIINPDEVFADALNCEGVLYRAYIQEKIKYVTETMAGEYTENVRTLSKTSSVIPSMDFGHLAPDWNFIMSAGIPGIIKRLEEYKTPENSEFYDCSVSVYKAVIDWLNRMADCARKFNTEKMNFAADNLTALTKSAPKTLAQAMQLSLIVYFLHLKLDHTNIRSLGGLDRLYYPFYKSDLESGRFTESQLRELTRDFFWKISAMKIDANTPFYICGKNVNGCDASNEYTKVLLEEYRKLDIYDPKIHVLYYDNMNREVLELILEMIREGKNSFVFMNTDIIEKSLMKIGVEPEDAKKIIIYGCYEPAAEGTEIPATCGGRIHLPKAIEFAINNGVDMITGETAGLKTGEDFNGFEEFYSAVKAQIKYMLDICMCTISAYEPHYDLVCPAPVLSPTFESCVKKGRFIFSGGAKYNNTSIVTAGLATLVDSIIVMKKAVFEEKLVSFSEMKRILMSDWEDNEQLRNHCISNYEKYGNNEPEADCIANDLYEFCAECVNNRKNGRGGVFRYGAFSVDWRFYMGKGTAATPDGRHSGEPTSKNLCAVIGQDKAGVTALLNTLLKFDAVKTPDGNVADIVLHSSAVAGESGMEALKGLLITYMTKGGYAVHFNALNPDDLKKAQKEPDKYKNLQVRICGWNARFVELTKTEQDEFIRQSEA